MLGDLTQHGQKLMVAKGGFHGLGSTRFRGSVNRAPRREDHGTRVLPVNSGDTSVLPQDTPQSTRVMPVQDAWNPLKELHRSTRPSNLHCSASPTSGLLP